MLNLCFGWFICFFDDLHPSQQFFSHVGTGLSGLHQHLAAAQGHNTETPPVVCMFMLKIVN